MIRAADPAITVAAEAGYRAALRAGLRDADARDLAQEALVRALSTARPPTAVPLAAWVYGIARNLGRDHAKSARSRELLVDEVDDHGDAAEDLATVLAVRQAVNDLPEPLRDVVTLHELEEHSLRETAEALAIPFDTAKDRLRRAREHLRVQLGDPAAACDVERTHARRRAATAGGAVAAAVIGRVGERVAAAAVSTGGAMVAMKLWVAIAASSVLVAAGFAAGRVSAPREPATQEPVVVASEHIAPVAAASAPAPVVPEPAPPPPPAPIAKPIVVPHAPSNPDAGVSSDHATERLLLDRARSGLQRGLPDEALVSLMEHARRFPQGTLAEERDVLLIEAYARSGNSELARRRIEAYRTEHPDGALRVRVDALAGALP